MSALRWVSHLSIVVCLLLGDGVHGQSPASSKAELLGLARRAHDAVKDVSVTFTFNAVEGPEGNITRSWATTTVKGEKVLISKRYGTNQVSGGKVFFRTIAFNGERTTVYEVNRRIASVSVGKSREASTFGLGFFDLAMFSAPQSGGQGVDDGSLVSFLSSAQTSVRPEQEMIGTVSCDVIDFIFNGEQLVTVWVDSKRGCVPMRQVIRRRGSPETILMEIKASEVEMVAPGIWFATRGTKRVRAHHAETGEDMEILNVMEVQRDDKGRPLIRVNSGIDNDEFDLWKHVPEGTELYGDLPEE